MVQTVERKQVYLTVYGITSHFYCHESNTRTGELSPQNIAVSFQHERDSSLLKVKTVAIYAIKFPHFVVITSISSRFRSNSNSLPMEITMYSRLKTSCPDLLFLLLSNCYQSRYVRFILLVIF